MNPRIRLLTLTVLLAVTAPLAADQAPRFRYAPSDTALHAYRLERIDTFVSIEAAPSSTAATPPALPPPTVNSLEWEERAVTSPEGDVLVAMKIKTMDFRQGADSIRSPIEESFEGKTLRVRVGRDGSLAGVSGYAQVLDDLKRRNPQMAQAYEEALDPAQLQLQQKEEWDAEGFGALRGQVARPGSTWRLTQTVEFPYLGTRLLNSKWTVEDEQARYQGVPCWKISVAYSVTPAGLEARGPPGPRTRVADGETVRREPTAWGTAELLVGKNGEGVLWSRRDLSVEGSVSLAEGTFDVVLESRKTRERMK